MFARVDGFTMSLRKVDGNTARPRGRHAMCSLATLPDGRARAHRAPDHLRHVQRGRSPGGGGLHQGLARGARDRRRGPPVRRPARAQRARRAARTDPTLVFHGHFDVVPGRAEQFVPRVEGDRLIGRGAYDMKGALASMMCAMRDLAEQDQVRVRLRRRARRGVRGHRAPHQRRPGPPRPRRRLRDHRRADRPPRRRPGQGRARRPADRPRPRRPRLDAVARRQRRPEGDRRLPANRVTAVLARVLRAVRPPVDQPRPDQRRRRAQHGPGRVHHGPRHPLPAQPGPGRHPRADPHIPDMEVARTFIHPPAHVSRTNPYVLALTEAVGRLDER